MNECSILAKSQYRKRHEKVRTYMYWLLCKKYHLQCSDKWYTHKPQSVSENDEYKILWDCVRNIAIKSKRENVKNMTKNSQQRTGKHSQVPGLKNRITESLECQGSGHTGSYSCSRNYVEENTSLYKTDSHPGLHSIHPRNTYLRNSLYLTKSSRHLGNWVHFRCLV